MKTLHGWRTSAVLLAISLTAFNSNARLAGVDFVPGSGDKWLTYDSETDFQWLDLSLTTNQTFDQVRTGEWIDQGFRYATRAEVQTLFDHAGIPQNGSAPAEALALLQLLGPTWGSRLGVAAYGLVGTDFLDRDVTLDIHPIGHRFRALVGKVKHFSAIGQVPELGTTEFGPETPFSDQASANYGSFLVRAVPEPGATAMTLFGLAAMGGWASRRGRRARQHAS